MELKSLFLGIFFSIGIFAVKSGVGLHYFLVQKRVLKKKPVLILLYCGLYFFIFQLCFHILKEIDVIRYFESMQNVLKSGMFVHILMAGLMGIWGVSLLKRKEDSKKNSFAWLAMVIPCPVCMTVIFFSIAFLLNYFPDSGDRAVYSVYTGFIGINLLTVILMRLWGTRSGATPEAILGAAMLIIAVYFILSVVIMPQFGDLDKIYRLAIYSGEKKMMDVSHLISLSAILSTSFVFGFLAMKIKIRRIRNWTSAHF